MCTELLGLLTADLSDAFAVMQCDPSAFLALDQWLPTSGPLTPGACWVADVPSGPQICIPHTVNSVASTCPAAWKLPGCVCLFCEDQMSIELHRSGRTSSCLYVSWYYKSAGYHCVRRSISPYCGRAGARFLGLRVRIPPGCMYACCAGRGLCVGLINRPEEYYREPVILNEQ
jgi:hypothetical protein